MFGDGFKDKGGSLSKQSKLSKQLIDIWATTFTPQTHWQLRLLIAAAVISLHAVVLLFPLDWLARNRPARPSPNAVKVTFSRAQTQPLTEQPVKESRAESSKPPSRNKPSQKKVLTAAEPEPVAAKDKTQVVTVPEAPLAKSSPAPERRAPPQTLMEDVVSPLLPAGKKDFLNQQRQLGEAIGAGPIAGDIEVPDVVAEKDPADPVTRTEYTFAGYFDNLSRRFAETWGGVRTLPPQSRFDGKLGEFIEYDIVINRDGTLRKIVNISARREPFRNFAAVDQLVFDVFKTMFPFQPVPARIRNDPLVVRKRIQFVGLKYTLY
ncbi:MAG: hypothetical protein EBR09_00060 [Proteobacteria bacterium]|nr:hypothetical protein [Pseudomonadota bacterium]